MVITALFVVNLAALVAVSLKPMGSRAWISMLLACLAVVTTGQFYGYVLNRDDFGPAPLYPGYSYEDMFRHNDFDPDRPFTSRYDYIPYDVRFDYWCNRPLTDAHPSITGYISTRNKATNRLMATVAPGQWLYIEPDSLRQDFAALTSVSTLVTTPKSRQRLSLYDNYTLIEETPRRSCYRFGYYIPMGMAYDKYMTDSAKYDDARLRASRNMVRAMLNALLISPDDEPVFAPYAHNAGFTDTIPLATLVDERRKHVCDTFVGDTHGFSASINLPDTMPVFFSVAADEGFKCRIDNEPARIHNVNMGLSAVIVPAGRHSIRFEYTPPGLAAGALVSLIALMALVAVAAVERRAANRR